MVDTLKFRVLFPFPDRKIKEKTIFGVGTNDADYIIKKHITDKNNIIKKQYTCYYYRKWENMLMRCYSEAYQKRRPNYKGCTVCEEWLSFMAFRAWMITKDCIDKELDKDLLSKDNKIYSPDTCVFITRALNSFMNDCGAARGDYPIGVSWYESSEQFRAQCNDPFTDKPWQKYCDTIRDAVIERTNYKYHLYNRYINLYENIYMRVAEGIRARRNKMIEKALPHMASPERENDEATP